MTLTVKEYSTLLHIQPKNRSMVYWKEPKKLKYRKKVSKILGMDGNDIEGSVKGESHGVPWNLLKPYIMRDGNEEQSMKLFTLAIYGLVVFPKVLGHIEISVIDFFEQVSGKKINPAPFIVAKTIRTLNFCKRKAKNCLLACTQLLYIWVQSHFWGAQKVPICPYSGACIPIKEFLKKKWPREITKEQWVTSFQSLESVNITWKAPWIATSAFIYRCGKNLWVPLPGLWELLVMHLYWYEGSSDHSSSFP
ncbi:hypothetical protein REPUB_Repub14bG0035900 [Reevesia pubescens]